MYSEDQLIKRISGSGGPKATCLRALGVRLGVGDDAAILSPAKNTDWVLSCDAFVEGVHFLTQNYPAESVGYKALARATSDLAAMGATPRAFLLTLALPAACTGNWLTKFLRGLHAAASHLGICLVGGDTTKFSRVSISITVQGEIARGLAVTRAGARPGDLIYVSGRLGRAQLGFELMRRKLGGKRRYHPLLQPHLYPRIPIALGRWLAREKLASAMMDISDGLSTDLARLCRASHVGAGILKQRIPAVEVPAAVEIRRLNLDPLQMALHGGEDYKLLFTIAAREKDRLREAPGSTQLVAIGQITAEKRILLTDAHGCTEPLKPEGWDPFRQR